MSTLQAVPVAVVPVLVTGAHIEPVMPTTDADGTIRLRFRAGAGLHQLSVVIDASAFDWEELYTVLNKFGNDNVRTGPWDFSLLNQSAPLVPSYWVGVDGKRLGLWFCERVSIDDIAAKRFRGRAAFALAQGGEHELTLTPYRPMNIRWISARLEPDPEDRLDPLPDSVGNAPGRIHVARWARPEFWEELKHRLRTTHAAYAAPLNKAFDWVIARWQHDPVNISLLLAAHHIGGRPEAMPMTLKVIDDYIARPSFGNPKEDGYSHNGDMGAAYALRGLAFAYHMLGDQLGPERTKLMLAKIQKHADIFFDLSLINRDYWGGSVLQDHGYTSFMHFAAAALAMRGVLPDAERWCRLAVTRVFRSLDAMPTDGALPPSGYNCPWMYPAHTGFFRDTYLSMGGPDIFARPHMRAIAPGLRAVFNAKSKLLENPHRIDLMGANAFFAAMAATFHDPDAAWVHEHMISATVEAFYHPNNEYAFYHSTIWGLINYDPSVTTVAPTPAKLQGIVHFEDSGLVRYHDDTTGVSLALHSGPWCGYNAYRKAQGPCDRMTMNVGQGHFCLYVDGALRLVTPDGGYKLQSMTSTCMLVDDAGQYGDIGYPMSIPSFLDRGAEVQLVRWDPATATGLIRLNLKPAYREQSGVLVYTREFLLAPARRIDVRDSVVLDRPRKLSWLFQGKREDGVEITGLRGKLGKEHALFIEPEVPPARMGGVDLVASIQETPVVFSYSSANMGKKFDHIRYDAKTPVQAATVDFVLSW